MTEHNDFGPTGVGAVLADVGGSMGALVLYTPECLVGAEIEVSPVQGGARTHVAVRERHAGRSLVFAAFYPSLTGGEYVVWTLDSRPAGTVTVAGGAVAERDVVMDTDAEGTRRFTLSGSACKSPPSGRPGGAAPRSSH